jgi:hypothetical protein
MAAPLIPPRFFWVTTAGAPAVGYKLNTYAAGTATPQATYTDSTLATANANPVVLDSLGSAAVWIGTPSYKFVLTDASNNVIWTADNVSEATLASVAGYPGMEWVPQLNATGGASTFGFISSTSFTINAGSDLSPVLTAGRRIKTQNTAGVVYSTITSVSYSAPNNTLVVVNDGSAAIDSGVSALWYGATSYVNPSYLDPRSCVHVTKSGNQSGPNGAVITGWNSPVVDALSEFASNKFTAKYPGKYWVMAQVEMSDTGTNVATGLYIQVGGVNQSNVAQTTHGTANIHTSMSVGQALSLTTGAQVQIVVTGSVNETIYGNPSTFISIIRIA